MRAKDPHPPTRSLPDVLGHASAFSSQNVGSLLGMNVQGRTLQGCRGETIDVLTTATEGSGAPPNTQGDAPSRVHTQVAVVILLNQFIRSQQKA